MQELKINLNSSKSSTSVPTKVSKKVSEGYTGKKEIMSRAEFKKLPKGIQNKIKNDVILKKAGGLVKRKYGGQIGTKSNSFSGSDFVASGYTKIGQEKKEKG